MRSEAQAQSAAFAAEVTDRCCGGGRGRPAGARPCANIMNIVVLSYIHLATRPLPRAPRQQEPRLTVADRPC